MVNHVAEFDKKPLWQKSNIKKAILNHTNIQIWTFAFNEIYSQLSNLLALLSPQELTLVKLKQQKQNQAIIAYGIRRVLLGKLLKIAPQEILFDHTQTGKPLIDFPKQPKLYFNLSHSDNQLVIAFSTVTELGIDVEKIKPRQKLMAIVDKYFSPIERKALLMLQGQPQLNLFYHYWVLKEAFIKATGQKLSNTLKNISIDSYPDLTNVNIIKNNVTSNWQLHLMNGLDNYALGLAYDTNRIKKPDFCYFAGVL